ncbi:MAG TPA: hypothetical protein VMS78_08855 [Rhizomicrobium sp.]|nr:hypothetical protein [Rhizomicrobium sp.]
MMKTRVYALPLVVTVLAGAASAQPLPPPPAAGGRLELHTINFDLWCQETAKLPPDRCDKRLPEDDAAYNAYVDKVEKYEVPYLKDRQKDDVLNRAILHSEPTQNPANNSQQPPSPNP